MTAVAVNQYSDIRIPVLQVSAKILRVKNDNVPSNDHLPWS